MSGASGMIADDSGNRAGISRLGFALGIAILSIRCFGGTIREKNDMDAHTATTARQATTAAPAYGSFALQEYTQTGLVQLVHMERDAAGGLSTREFAETQSHGGEFHAYKPVAWNEPVPEGALLMGANSGNVNDYYKIFWALWRDQGQYKALALTQENPIAVPVQADDRYIASPFQAQDKKLRLFFWRKSGAGYSLHAHVFTAEPGKSGSVATEKILDVGYEPLQTHADPIAMKWIPKQGFADAGLAVIGWLSSDGSGMRAHVLKIDGKGARLTDSDPIAGYKPFPDQRLGIWGDPDGPVRMAWLMGRTDADSVRAAEWTVRDGQMSLRYRENGYAAKNLKSAACVVKRKSEEEPASCYLATRTGNLYLDDNGGRLHKMRADLAPDYDFPIFSSGHGVWEARFDEKGGISFAVAY
jgi:hypothetical protein